MNEKNVVREIELVHDEKALKVRALFDTGAEKSQVSKTMASQLTDRFLTKPGWQVRLPDGSIIPAHQVLEAQLRIDDCTGMASEFLVMPNPPYDVVVGRPDLDSWGVEFTPEGPKTTKCPVAYNV